MPGFKSIKKLVSSSSNIGRGISGMIFNAVAFLILKNSGDNKALLTYSWFLVITNVFVTFTGWGLRDYSIKQYVKNLSSVGDNFSLLLSSKIPLLITSFVVILFIPSVLSFKFSLILLVSIRTVLALTDPLVLSLNRTLKVFLWECVFYLAAITCILFFPVMRSKLIEVLVITEALRVIISSLYVYDKGILNVKWRAPYFFLYETRFYFAIALFSFFMSRVDVYILGWYSKTIFFADYSIILNLLAFSQIIIASVYNNTIKSVFRLDLKEASKILDKLTLQFFTLSLAATITIIAVSGFVYNIELSKGFYFLLLINLFFYCITLKYIYILNHSGKPSFFLVGAIISALVNFTLAVILVPIYEINGAIISNTFGVIILVVVLNYIIKNKILTIPKPY